MVDRPGLRGKRIQLALPQAPSPRAAGRGSPFICSPPKPPTPLPWPVRLASDFRGLPLQLSDVPFSNCIGKVQERCKNGKSVSPSEHDNRQAGETRTRERQSRSRTKERRSQTQNPPPSVRRARTPSGHTVWGAARPPSATPHPRAPPGCPSRSVAISVAQARKARLGEARPVAHATQQARSSASAARAASLPRPPLPPRLRNAAPPSGRRASLLGDGHHPGGQGVLLPSTSGPGGPPPPGVR